MGVLIRLADVLESDEYRASRRCLDEAEGWDAKTASALRSFARIQRQRAIRAAQGYGGRELALPAEPFWEFD